MNKRQRKKRDNVIRKQIHEILDLVLDINGLQESITEKTGNHPTVFFEFSGHIGMISVQLHSYGWGRYATNEPDAILKSSVVFEDFRCNLPAVSEGLKDFLKRGVSDGDD